MATFMHIDGAETETEDIVFACLSWALSIALAINELLVIAALRLISCTRLNAGAIVINLVVWADRGAHIALCDHEGRRALRVPLLLTLLAIMALLVLSIASPEGKRLFTAKFSLFEEFGAGKATAAAVYLMVQHMLRLVISRLTSTSLLALLTSLLSLGLASALFTWLFRLLSLTTLLASFSCATLLLLAVSMTLGSSVATGTGRGGMAIVCQGGSSVHRRLS